MPKQISKNKIDFNFANILNNANASKFPKICDFCNEIFEVDLYFVNKSTRYIRCPICYSIYYVIYNELNDFNYLEFIKPPDSIYLEDIKLNHAS